MPLAIFEIKIYLDDVTSCIIPALTAHRHLLLFIGLNCCYRNICHVKLLPFFIRIHNFDRRVMQTLSQLLSLFTGSYQNFQWIEIPAFISAYCSKYEFLAHQIKSVFSNYSLSTHRRESNVKMMLFIARLRYVSEERLGGSEQRHLSHETMSHYLYVKLYVLLKAHLDMFT